MNIPRLTKKKSLIFSGVLLSVIILLIVITGILSQSQRTGKEQAKKEGVRDVPEYPKVEVRSWTAGAAPITVPETLRVYDLKEPSHEEQAVSLSQILLGTNQIEKVEEDIYASTLQSEKDLTAFVYNSTKREFSYASTNGIALPGAADAPVETKINTFLNILFFDPTLKITSSYKRKDKPGIVYYEIHRDWSSVGLPILNAFGLTTLKADVPLTSLVLGNPAQVRGQDPNIYNTSDSTDGLPRADDFNTMTIGIREEGNSIYTIKSNIRQLHTTQLKQVRPIVYEEALSQLRKGDYEFLYTAPSGEGFPTFDKVYPDNKGVAQEARITESMVTYIEKSPLEAQGRLIPYYIFRGTTRLDSGYQVNFTAGVPAVSAQGMALGIQSALAQTFPQNPYDSSMKIGTFSNPTITPGPCGIGVSCPPSITPGCGIGLSCPPTPPTRTPTPRCGIGLSCPPTPTPTCGVNCPSPTPTPTSPFVTVTVPPPTATPTPTPPCTVDCASPTPTPTATPTPTPPCNFFFCPPIVTRTPTPTPTPPCTVDCEPTTELPCTGPLCYLTGIPRLPTATPQPPIISGPCIPAEDDLENTTQISPNVFIGSIREAEVDRLMAEAGQFGWIRGDQQVLWYSYAIGKSLVAEDIVAGWEEIRKRDPVAVQRPIAGSISTFIRLYGSCPIRITGWSPSIFTYGEPGDEVIIKPHAQMSYTDPGIDQVWNARIISADGTLQVGQETRDFLYYEYKPVTFNKPQKGWTVEKEELGLFVSKVAAQLELNQKEKERLLFELNHAASSLSDKTLFVGLVSESEIAQKLPLEITGIDNIIRLHFYVAPGNQSTIPPELIPLERSSSMVLELGAVAE